MRPKGMEDLAGEVKSAREVKRAAEGRERNGQEFLCRRTMIVKVGGKVIPASFLKIEKRGTLVGEIDRRERDRGRGQKR